MGPLHHQGRIRHVNDITDAQPSQLTHPQPGEAEDQGHVGLPGGMLGHLLPLARRDGPLCDHHVQQLGITYSPWRIVEGTPVADSVKMGKGSLYARFEEQGYPITTTREELRADASPRGSEGSTDPRRGAGPGRGAHRV